MQSQSDVAENRHHHVRWFEFNVFYSLLHERLFMFYSKTGIIMSEGSSSTLLRERLFMKPKFYSKKCFQAPVSKAIVNIYEDRKFSSWCYVQFYTRLPWTLWLYWSWSPWYADIVELDQNSECQVFQKWERQFRKLISFFLICVNCPLGPVG